VSRLVARLGTLRPFELDPATREAVAAAPPVELGGEVFKEIYRHRVVDVALRNLERSGAIEPAFVDLQRRLASEPLHEGGDPEATAARVLGFPGGEDAIFIKGTATSLAYPAPYRRDFGDVDIIVRGFDALWPLVAAARGSFRFERLKVYQYAGRIGGGVDLDPTGGGDLLMIDVHVGGYHMWGANRYGPDLWARAQRLSGRLVPSWEDCVLITAAHLATCWVYRLRDVNDVIAVTRHAGARFDWDYVARVARDEHLGDLIGALLDRAEDVYGESVHPIGWLRRRPGAARLFAQRNYGHSDRLGAVVAQSRLSLGRYPRDFGALRGALECAKNGLNLVRFDNRAFRADGRRRLRRIGPNQILVLIPLSRDPAPKHEIGRSFGASSLRVVNEGQPEEHFVTPCGIFIQAGYHGGIEDEERALLRTSLVPR
jgi:hypothetical protein